MFKLIFAPNVIFFFFKHKISSIILLYLTIEDRYLDKLDGKGPVDNKPSNNKLHKFVKKKIYIYIFDICHVTCDM